MGPVKEGCREIWEGGELPMLPWVPLHSRPSPRESVLGLTKVWKLWTVPSSPVCNRGWRPLGPMQVCCLYSAWQASRVCYLGPHLWMWLGNQARMCQVDCHYGRVNSTGICFRAMRHGLAGVLGRPWFANPSGHASPSMAKLRTISLLGPILSPFHLHSQRGSWLLP